MAIINKKFVMMLALSCHMAGVSADNGNIGADYAFLTIMTLEPEISAARYKIDSDNGDIVDIRIVRLPFHNNISENENSRLDFETAIGHQSAHESFHYIPSNQNDYVDSYWTTNGISFGLLYARTITKQLNFTPNFRLGVAQMKNDAYYYGPVSNLLKDYLENNFLGWTTDVSVTNFSLGLDYRWKIQDRSSHINCNFSHIVANTFHESSAAASFHETANLINSSVEMIIPSHQLIKNKRIDYSVLLGSDYFVGENRHTLGYVISYQIGIGAEIPFRLWREQAKHLRIGILGQWASVMRSWTLSLSYND